MESPVSIQLNNYGVSPVGFMKSHVIPNATVVDSGEPSVRYIVWNFGELVNGADNVETVQDKLLFEVMRNRWNTYGITLSNVGRLGIFSNCWRSIGGVCESDQYDDCC